MFDDLKQIAIEGALRTNPLGRLGLALKDEFLAKKLSKPEGFSRGDNNGYSTVGFNVLRETAEGPKQIHVAITTTKQCMDELFAIAEGK